jgi:class 3 adenylate cyclase/tetratricopeptide (TPR) repeat protein
MVCPGCGSENRDGARFCDFCAAPLTSGAPAREARKTVTIVFCDMVGSTALGERSDPELLRRVMRRFFNGMRAVLERHGGSVEKFIGDAVLAVFGVPKTHEDDPLRAVRAAAEMRSALAELNEGLMRELGVTVEARIGVNTGETAVGDPTTGENLVTGDAVNLAARLEQAAEPGEILIGASTYRMVRDAVRVEPVKPFSVKGKAEPVTAYRLIEVEPEGAVARRSDITLVGRRREMRLISDSYEQAVSDRTCHLVTILGVAGVGKSRLVAEALTSLSPQPLVLSGRCLPYGDGITFWPVAEMVKQAAGVSEADTAEAARSKVGAIAPEGLVGERVCELMGLSPPGASLEEGFWGIRKLLEATAGRSPLVVTFDDLQWAEPMLLDLIEHVADWSRDAPIVILCMARPEFLELRPGWGGGKMNAVSLLLEPLSADESAELMGDLLSGAQVPPSARAKVLETAGGNPLFVEEVLASLIEEGHLRREGETWQSVGDLSAVKVPPTIQALLSARLDRLGREELAVIEGAAVVGQVFYRGAVSELSPEALRPDVGTYLLSLVRKDLVRPDASTFAGEEAFRFRHLLIRDAAHRAMPKQTRAELHERFAGWLGRTAGDRLPEYEEIVGYHMEQAFRYREELGPLDDAARALAAEAGHVLGRAGVRASKRADFSASRSLLGRALTLLPDGADAVDWLMRSGRAQHILGNIDEATHAHEQAVARAEASADPTSKWRARLAYAKFLVFIDPHWSFEDARAMADAALPELEALGDDYGLALAWRLLGDVELTSGRFAEWGRACQRAVEHARRADDWGIQQAASGDLAYALLYDPTPVPEALDQCRKIVEESQGLIRFWTLGVVALLEAMAGRFDRSTELLEESRAGYADLGPTGGQQLNQWDIEGQIELLAGHPERTAESYRSSLDALKASGNLVVEWALIAGRLAEALYQLGRDDEAEAYALESEQLAPTDPMSQAQWRAVRAKVLARRGELMVAEALAREAVELSTATDQLQLQGDTLLDLAEVLGMAGSTEESRERIREALELYERKGIVVMANRARALLGP